MQYYCTYSDKNYLLKGLALNQSLSETIECDYVLFYLCLDDETYNTLVKLDHRFIHPVNIKELEEQDKNIALARKLGASQYGDDYSAFCWALSAIWINFCLKNFVPEGAQLVYADSDIYFYAPIVQGMSVDTMGIHTHRFSTYDYKTNPVGEFNVGVMIFRNNSLGNTLCEIWKNWILNIHHPERDLYGTCGDQKWLDKLYRQYEQAITVFDLKGNLGHIAPWNSSEAEALNFNDRKFTFKGRTQVLAFYHFSHFRIDWLKGTWHSSTKGEWAPERDPEIHKIYQHYFEVQQKIKTQLG